MNKSRRNPHRNARDKNIVHYTHIHEKKNKKNKKKIATKKKLKYSSTKKNRTCKPIPKTNINISPMFDTNTTHITKVDNTPVIIDTVVNTVKIIKSKYECDRLTHVLNKPIKKSLANKLKVGDYLSRISYCKILNINNNYNNNYTYRIENEDKYAWTIGGDIIENEMIPLSHYHTVHKKTKTELAKILINVGNIGFIVCFEKKLQAKKVQYTLDQNTDSLTNKELSKNILKGVDRVMLCRLIDTEPLLGRSYVMDLEINEKRLIDHRTIKWIVYNYNKYELK